jgi:hypothetical protein
MAVTVKKTIIFRNVTPFSLVGRYQRLGETSCLHIQGIPGSPFVQNVGTYLRDTKINQIPDDSIFQVPTEVNTGLWLQAGKR